MRTSLLTRLGRITWPPCWAGCSNLFGTRAVLPPKSKKCKYLARTLQAPELYRTLSSLNNVLPWDYRWALLAVLAGYSLLAHAFYKSPRRNSSRRAQEMARWEDTPAAGAMGQKTRRNR